MLFKVGKRNTKKLNKTSCVQAGWASDVVVCTGQSSKAGRRWRFGRSSGIGATISRSHMSFGNSLHVYSERSRCNMSAHVPGKSVITMPDLDCRLSEPTISRKEDADTYKDNGQRPFFSSQCGLKMFSNGRQRLRWETYKSRRHGYWYWPSLCTTTTTTSVSENNSEQSTFPLATMQLP